MQESPRTFGGQGGTIDFAVKERRKVEGNRDLDKKKDWWRTSTASDADGNNRRDAWREEEREWTQGR